MSRPLQIAHRGGMGVWPENTVEAFELAIDFGVDGIELDVHLSGDGQLVVHHDERLNPSIARGPDGVWLDPPTPLIKLLSVSNLHAYNVGRLRPGSTYAAQHPDQQPIDGASIPRLEDVYRLVRSRARPGFRLYVELKTSLRDPTQSADPIKLAEAAVILTLSMEIASMVTFASIDWRTLLRAKELSPGIPCVCTTLPLAFLNPDDPSALIDKPNSEIALLRRRSATGAPWMAGLDWRAQPGQDFSGRMLRAIAAGPADGWFAWHGDVTPETVSLAHQFGLDVFCWTVNEPEEMSRLAALGVDGILTDRPDRLAQTLDI